MKFDKVIFYKNISSIPYYYYNETLFTHDGYILYCMNLENLFNINDGFIEVDDDLIKNKKEKLRIKHKALYSNLFLNTEMLILNIGYTGYFVSTNEEFWKKGNFNNLYCKLTINEYIIKSILE